MPRLSIVRQQSPNVVLASLVSDGNIAVIPAGIRDRVMQNILLSVDTNAAVAVTLRFADMQGDASGFYGLATDNHGVWLVGTKGSGNSRVYRSLDDGFSWDQAWETGRYDVWSIATDDAGVWVALVRGGAVVGSTTYIYRSADNGATWTLVHTVANSDLRHVCCELSGVYCALSDSKILRSADGGVTWASVYTASGEILEALACERGGSQVFLAVGTSGTVFKVHRSADSGATWSVVYTSGSGFSSVDTIANKYDTNIWVLSVRNGGKSRLYRSADDGATWTLVHTHTTAEDVTTGETAILHYTCCHRIPSGDTDVITVPEAHSEAIIAFVDFRVHWEMESEEAYTLSGASDALILSQLGENGRRAWTRWREVMSRLQNRALGVINPIWRNIGL